MCAGSTDPHAFPQRGFIDEHRAMTAYGPASGQHHTGDSGCRPERLWRRPKCDDDGGGRSTRDGLTATGKYAKDGRKAMEHGGRGDVKENHRATRDADAVLTRAASVDHLVAHRTSGRSPPPRSVMSAPTLRLARSDSNEGSNLSPLGLAAWRRFRAAAHRLSPKGRGPRAKGVRPHRHGRVGEMRPSTCAR